MSEIRTPFEAFRDADGTPLDGGYIYIGIENQEPITHPANVFWDADLTIAAAQPIRTIGGYPVRAGAPAKVYASGSYSICVKNKNGEIIVSAVSSGSLEALLASATSTTKGMGMVGAGDLAYAEGTVGERVVRLDKTMATAGTAPSFTLAPITALSAYTIGKRYRVCFHAGGTTGSNTLNISGLGAKNLKQYSTSGSKTSGVVVSGMICSVEYDGTDFVILNPIPQVSEFSGRLLATTYYLTAGTFTYTKATNNPSFIRVRMVGGGGSSGKTTSAYTGAGAGGGYSEKTIQASDLNATETIVIGAGGIAVTVDGTGNNGGTTSFGAHCSATGGSGGGNVYNDIPASGGTGIGGNLNAAGDGRSGYGSTGGSSAFSAGVVGAAGILGSGGASGNEVSFAGGPGAMIIEEYA